MEVTNTLETKAYELTNETGPSDKEVARSGAFVAYKNVHK